jgi:copper chaperone CopZ
MTETITVKTIPIIRMDCPTCIPVLEREVLKVEGVQEVRGNYMAKSLKVTFDHTRAQLADIETAVERVGYRIAYKKYPSPLSRLRGLFKREKGVEVASLMDADFPGKVLLSLADKLGGEADFYEVDIEATETWRDYDILSIPQVLIFRAGKVSERFTAMPVAAEIERALVT